MLLLHQNATVTICHSKTRDLGAITRQADILVAAIGRPGFITLDMVKPGAVLIDVGINRIDKRETSTASSRATPSAKQHLPSAAPSSSATSIPPRSNFPGLTRQSPAA